MYSFISQWTFGFFTHFGYTGDICVQLFCVDIFSFLWKWYLWVEMLGYMTNCVQNFQELPNGILNWLHCFTFSAIYENSTFSVSLPVLLLCFLIQEILVGLKHYPIVVLICNFLTTNDIEHLFSDYWSFLDFLWKKKIIQTPDPFLN